MSMVDTESARRVDRLVGRVPPWPDEAHGVGGESSVIGQCFRERASTDVAQADEQDLRRSPLANEADRTPSTASVKRSVQTITHPDRYRPDAP